jgi:cardiolipin synthase
MAALHLAGLRGVDVRVLIPDEPDHLLVYLAAFAYFAEAKASGAKFYRYTQGFLHQKVLLVDDRVATIGTANLDNRSFRLNFEITAIVADTGFAAQVEEMLAADLEHSRLMVPGDTDGRSWAFKLAVRLAHLAAPML